MTRLVLTEIRRRYVEAGRSLPSDLEQQLRADPRAGAQAILDAVARRRAGNRAEGQRLRKLLRFERALWAQGLRYVAGVDEAGMSPLAGPVVAGAVILPVDVRIRDVDDSKKLSPEARGQLVQEIRACALAVGVGRVDPEEIDSINIYHAGLLAMRRAVEALQILPQHLLVDARRIALDIPQDGIIQGDTKSQSIAAASIVAKTTRDGWMVEFDAQYPGYGFAKHKGYGVPEHYRALKALGPTPIHRRSFPVVQKVLAERA